MNDQILDLLVALAAIGALIWLGSLAFREAKKLDLDISMYLMTLFANNLHAVMFVVIIVSNVAEGLIAASVAEEGVSKLARVILHTSLVIMGFVGPGLVIIQLRNLALSISGKKFSFAQFFGSLFFIIVGFFLAVGAPVTNFIIAVKQLGGDEQAVILVSYLSYLLGYGSIDDYYYTVNYFGHDPQVFSLFAALSGTVTAMSFTIVAHMLSMFYEFYLVYVFAMKKTQTTVKETVKEIKVEDAKNTPQTETTTAESKTNPSKEDVTEQSIAVLLNFLGVDPNKSKDIIGNIMTNLRPYLNPTNDEVQKVTNQIAFNIADLRNKAEKLMSDAEKGVVFYQETEALKNAIIQFIKKNHANGGLGYKGPLEITV